MIAVGIDIGGTNIKLGLVDRNAGFLEKTSFSTEARKGKVYMFDKLGEKIHELLAEYPQTPVGIGVGIPGMVSLDRSTVKSPPNLPGWSIENVAHEIQNRIDLPCVIENDANVAALGSAFYGAGKPHEHFIMLTLGTGVGGGIIIGKKLYRGTTGAAAELGHVLIDYKGAESNSNTRGGIEAYLGQRFISRRAAAEIKKHPDNPLYKQFSSDFNELEPLDLSQAANKGNKLAIEILANAGEMLGYAIVNYIHMLDIRKIVLSGGVANAGKWIIEPAKKSALNYLMPPFHDDFEIIIERLGNDAAMLGAAALAFEVFS